MTEYELEIATRHIKRQFEKGVGGSILKVLAEVATNTDDSYSIIESILGEEAETRDGFGSIVIDFDRSMRSLAVVDQAEGLTEDEMKEHFLTYGEESRGREGARTRSLFGKGLRDVLFTQVNGQVKSIKNGKSYVSKFKWRDRDGKVRPVVDIRLGPPVTPELRDSWGIVADGTRVDFKLQESLSTPQFDRLAERLANFYMLRLITSNPARHVSLRHLRKSVVLETRDIRYVAPAETASSHLGKHSWSWMLPEGTVSVEVDLRSFETDLVQGEVNYEDREGGLLVTDENDAVLDLSLFGYDTDPAAARFYGTLKLDGIGRIIRGRLNSATPEELLTETRDGFDRRNETYIQLKRDLDKWLAPFVDEERKRRAGGAEGLSARTKKRHQEALEKLNSLYRKLTGDAAGTGGGSTPRHLSTDKVLEFRWRTLLLQTGHSYAIQLLVNTAHVPADELVNITSSNPGAVYPIEAHVVVPSPYAEDRETVVCAVKVDPVSAGNAIVVASHGSSEAAIECVVVDEEVPDMSEGFAFLPETINVPDGDRATIKLFADLRVTGEAAEIRVESDNENIEARLVGSWEPVTANVVRSNVSIVGRGKGQSGILTARGGSAEALGMVEVVSKKNRRKDGGHFKDYKFQEIENRKIQILTDSEGFLIVNLLDPTNRYYFGGDSDEATRRVEQSTAAQTLLADLVLGECLQQAIQEAYLTGKLPPRMDEVTDIQNYVAEQRFDIGSEIHKLFVTKPVIPKGGSG